MNKRRRFKAKRRRRDDRIVIGFDWSGSLSRSVAMRWDSNGECWLSIDDGVEQRAPAMDFGCIIDPVSGPQP